MAPVELKSFKGVCTVCWDFSQNYGTLGVKIFFVTCRDFYWQYGGFLRKLMCFNELGYRSINYGIKYHNKYNIRVPMSKSHKKEKRY